MKLRSSCVVLTLAAACARLFSSAGAASVDEFSRGTYTATSYTGADGADDPQWRVYVASGTCTPIPGPQTYVDPN